MTKKQIFLAIFLSLFAISLLWYYRSQTAKNIVSGVITSPTKNLRSDQDRVNVVLLGIGGEGHEGSDLTDSILAISLDLRSNSAVTIPIPRDIWVPSIAAKINTAYHYGQLPLAKQALSEIIGIPIHYAITLDFQGFVKAIDIIGGLEVVVDRSFDDYEYPLPGRENALPVSSRYEHLHFDAGPTHMDGATALKFVRSRHAIGDEGTDFARGERQQKVLLAFRNKMLSSSTIFNADLLTKLRDNVYDSIDTDITSLEQGSFLKLILGLNNKDKVTSLSINDFLSVPKSTDSYGGQWVLIPAPSTEDLQSYVKTQLAK